jgi:hypothetical protein
MIEIVTTPLLWFCRGIYEPLARLFGVHRSHLVWVSWIASFPATGLTLYQSHARVVLGIMYAVLLPVWGLTLARHEREQLITTSGIRSLQKVGLVLEAGVWAVLTGVWFADLAQWLAGLKPLAILAPYWWYALGRGFQSIDDEDGGEPVAQRLWRRARELVATPAIAGQAS